MKSFLGAMADAFGPKTNQKPGQTLQEFSQEIKALSVADREWYHRELIKSGIECEVPGEKK